MRQRYTASDFEPHIPNSGGIIDTIATRAGCAWQTAANHIRRTPRLQALFDAECETALDLAESVIVGNILAAAALQKAAAAAGGDVPIVDSSDAKWFLSKKGKARGYGEVSAVTLRTAPGPIEMVTIRAKMVAMGVSEEFLPDL